MIVIFNGHANISRRIPATVVQRAHLDRVKAKLVLEPSGHLRQHAWLLILLLLFWLFLHWLLWLFLSLWFLLSLWLLLRLGLFLSLLLWFRRLSWLLLLWLRRLRLGWLLLFLGFLGRLFVLFLLLLLKLMLLLLSLLDLFLQLIKFFEHFLLFLLSMWDNLKNHITWLRIDVRLQRFMWNDQWTVQVLQANVSRGPDTGVEHILNVYVVNAAFVVHVLLRDIKFRVLALIHEIFDVDDPLTVLVVENLVQISKHCKFCKFDF